MNVYAILQKVAEIIETRGTERDLPDGERSMPRCIKAFNAITGKNLTIADGWMLLALLKFSRSQEGSFKPDDYYDIVGYATLLAEEVFNDNAIQEDKPERASGMGAPHSGGNRQL